MKKVIILLSGGVDSTSALYWAKARYEVALCLGFSYGSKHNLMEVVAAKSLCCLLGLPYQLIHLGFIQKFFKSSLLQKDCPVPEGHYAAPSMKSTVVPFRNGIMLSIAAGMAESLRASGIVIANHFGDHAIYPDCRKDFSKSMASAIRLGTYQKIKLLTPFVSKTKRRVALIGKGLGANLSKTYSCYNGRRLHCGVCGTCVERKEALKGFDSTRYEK